MLRRQCFLLALTTAVSLVGTARGQQSAMDDPSYFAQGPAYPQGPSFGQRPGPGPAQQTPPPPPHENWWQRWKRDYHRNQCWPEPFIAGDRQAVNVPFQIMADNAWQRQNLLSEVHFVQGTADLTDAGRYKLLWIIMRAPTQHRAVFVDRLLSDKSTAERVATVQRTIAMIAPDRPPIPVYVSDLGPGDWSGSNAAEIVQAREKSVPEPRLPMATRPTISN